MDALINLPVIVALQAFARTGLLVETQLPSYVRSEQKAVGLLINVHVPRLAEEVRHTEHGPRPLFP